VILAVLGAGALAVSTDLTEVRACHVLDGGDVLVGTGGGLARYDARGNVRAVWTAVDGLPGTRIDGISKLGDALWIGTELGAAQIAFDGAAIKVTRTAEQKAVRQLIEFGGDTYVATWEGGVKKLGARREAALPFKGGNNPAARSRVSSLAVADGALWAGTANGLYRLRGGTFELTSIEAGANEVLSLYGDGAQLWIGTSAGLYVREGSYVRGFGGGDVRKVTKLDGAIVAATFGGGLIRIDRGRLVDLAGTPEGLAMAQAIASKDGAACAGGLNGLWLRSSATAAWTEAKRPAGPPANDISALAVSGDKLYVGTFDHGLAVREAGVWRTIESKKLDHRVNAILVDGKRVWVATAAGLSIIEGAIDREPGLAITQLTKTDGLPARGILALAKLADGRVLAGTSAGAAIIANGRATTIGAKQGLEAKNVWAVAQDADGWIWLGTTTGLFRGKPDDTEWTRYSVATGHLTDDWVMALAVKGTTVYAGTYKGGVMKFEGATSTKVADGWINPGGLSFDGDTLVMATMEGLRGVDRLGRLTGKDVTAAVRVGDTLVVATRRGLVSRPGYWTR
jgi:ligand-binding sensor domain-containing protein